MKDITNKYLVKHMFSNPFEKTDKGFKFGFSNLFGMVIMDIVPEKLSNYITISVNGNVIKDDNIKDATIEFISPFQATITKENKKDLRNLHIPVGTYMEIEIPYTFSSVKYHTFTFTLKGDIEDIIMRVRREIK